MTFISVDSFNETWHLNETAAKKYKEFKSIILELQIGYNQYISISSINDQHQLFTICNSATVYVAPVHVLKSNLSPSPNALNLETCVYVGANK